MTRTTLLTTGTHDHAAPPPLPLGSGCTACDAWALHWLSPRQADIADEHLGEMYKDAGEAGPGSISFETLAAFLEERALEEDDADPELAAEIRDTYQAIRRMTGYGDPPPPEELEDRIHELVAQGFAYDEARRMAASDDWMAEPEPEPRPDLELAVAGVELLESIDRFVAAYNRRGGRDSESPMLRRFGAYHLADLQGNGGGGGWLAGNLMADDLRALIRAEREGEEEDR